MWGMGRGGANAFIFPLLQWLQRFLLQMLWLWLVQLLWLLW
jgi:hypothetical protein